ncbi:UNVERIFIED_CONTAM: hypothetical protein HDU68_009056 [Siphonaria sp. JEL0065]|nr:hypothetical protein HDU68_009056 [Siphonaria sp. JEL0065]
MSSLTMQCSAFFAYNPAMDGTCAEAAASSLNAVACVPASSVTCPGNSVPSVNVCAATAQNDTYTANTCALIPLSNSGAVSLPPSLVTGLSLYATTIVASYATDVCQGQPSSVGLFVLNTCNPSPFNDGAWGMIYNDFANNLYYDQYDDPNCFSYTDSKVGKLFAKQGSSCTNKVSASIFGNKGFQTTIYYSDNCSTVSRIILGPSLGPCSAQSSCVVSKLSGVSKKYASCQSDPTSYDFLDAARTSFGSKPFLVSEGYADKNCLTAAPVSKSAILLDTCLTSTTANGSSIYTQAANGSLVYSHYSKVGCTGDLLVRDSKTATCDQYAKYSLYNTKSPLAPGSSSGSPVPTATKSSSGFAVEAVTLAGVLAVFTFGML